MGRRDLPCLLPAEWRTHLRRGVSDSVTRQRVTASTQSRFSSLRPLIDQSGDSPWAPWDAVCTADLHAFWQVLGRMVEADPSRVGRALSGLSFVRAHVSKGDACAESRNAFDRNGLLDAAMTGRRNPEDEVKVGRGGTTEREKVRRKEGHDASRQHEYASNGKAISRCPTQKSLRSEHQQPQDGDDDREEQQKRGGPERNDGLAN